MPATVTFYRGHRRTICCLPGIIFLIIKCVGIIFQIITFSQADVPYRATAQTELRTTLRASRSTANGAQVIRPLDYTDRLKYQNVLFWEPSPMCIYSRQKDGQIQTHKTQRWPDTNMVVFSSVRVSNSRSPKQNLWEQVDYIFIGWMSLLSPTQQCWSTEGNTRVAT